MEIHFVDLPQAAYLIALQRNCSKTLLEKRETIREKVELAIRAITIDANEELLFDLRTVIELNVGAMNHRRSFIAIE